MKMDTDCRHWIMLASVPVLTVLAFKGEGALALAGLLVMAAVAMYRDRTEKKYSAVRAPSPIAGHKTAYVTDPSAFAAGTVPVYPAPSNMGSDRFEGWAGGVLTGVGSSHLDHRKFAERQLVDRREKMVGYGWTKSFF
ncbi:hypothetical protein [Tiger frog virus]|uniref:Uncharacterized protein n=1 Tax=Rana tigrina ranavirus TaxID=160691 RepID=A0A6M8PD01_RTRV|nr:hypothetical protein [Tiger frog virus]